jgi:hypothetical protein
MGDTFSDLETHTFVNGDFTPLERVVLTANGNLQRILRWEPVVLYAAAATLLIFACSLEL